MARTIDASGFAQLRGRARRGLGSATGAVVRFARRILRPRAVVRIAAVLGVLILTGYGLAWLALEDEARTARERADDPVSAEIIDRNGETLVATAGRDGVARVYRGQELIGVVRGHAAQIERVAFADGGDALITTDSSGVSQITRIDSMSAYNPFDLDEIGETLHRDLWVPYGAPGAAAWLSLLRSVALEFPTVMQGRGILTFRDCPECPEMVMVPAGDFTMGTSLPRASPATVFMDQEGSIFVSQPHSATVANAFLIGKYDVTREEYGVFVRATGRTDPTACAKRTPGAGSNWRNPGFAPVTARDPVVCVSWDDAEAYVEWLSAKTGEHYRLPTEIEWEYAARTGTTTRWFWGDNIADYCGYANFADASAPCKDGYAHTSPVGSYLPNSFGLYDMVGNVRQWVDQKGPQARALRAARGNSWLDDGRSANSAIEILQNGSTGENILGFRVARDL